MATKLNSHVLDAFAKTEIFYAPGASLEHNFEYLEAFLSYLIVGYQWGKVDDKLRDLIRGKSQDKLLFVSWLAILSDKELAEVLHLAINKDSK